MCAESIPGLTLPKCLRRPVPLPVEEAGWRSYTRHLQAEKFPLQDLEMASKGASTQLQIDHGW